MTSPFNIFAINWKRMDIGRKFYRTIDCDQEFMAVTVWFRLKIKLWP